MIKKFFITTSAKSKGFVTGSYLPYSNHASYKLFDYSTIWPKPSEYKFRVSFTKHTALAPQFDTIEEAKEFKNNLGIRAEHEHKLSKYKLAFFELADIFWEFLTPAEKLSFARKYHLIHFNAWLNRGKNNAQIMEFNIELNREVSNLDFSRHIIYHKYVMDCCEKYLKDLDTKLFITEHDVEIKFLDSEKYCIDWRINDTRATKGSYCNCCGAHIPAVALLNIANVNICVICMHKLNEEAERFYKRIPDDILKTYKQDRFLRSI
jgi:hypothetical protein